MFDVVAARFKVEPGVPASFAEDATPTFPARGRAGGDFVLVAAEELELAGVFVASVPGFTFFCGYMRQQVTLFCGYDLTCMLMVSMRLPVSLTTTAFGGLSKARRSITRIFPFSVPKYMAAPSGENPMVVRGTLTLRDRKILDITSKTMNSKIQYTTYALSFSKSIRPTNPPDVAAAIRVLLKGLHAIAEMVPEAVSVNEIVFNGPDGRVVSYIIICFPAATMSLVLQ